MSKAFHLKYVAFSFDSRCAMRKHRFQSLAQALALVQSVVAIGLLLLGGWMLSSSSAGLVSSGGRSTYATGMLVGSLGLGSILVAVLAALLAFVCFRIGTVRRNLGLLDKVVVAASVAFTFGLTAALTAWLW